MQRISGFVVVGQSAQECCVGMFEGEYARKVGVDPHMGSGSFLGRNTLVQIPDVFLTSPQFLHRAFLFRIKSISVNK